MAPGGNLVPQGVLLGFSIREPCRNIHIIPVRQPRLAHIIGVQEDPLGCYELWSDPHVFRHLCQVLLVEHPGSDEAIKAGVVVCFVGCDVVNPGVNRDPHGTRTFHVLTRQVRF